MPSVLIMCDSRACYIRGAYFQPQGKLQFHGNVERMLPNPDKWGDAKDSPLWSVRLFVGLERQNAKGKVVKRYSLAKLIALVKKVRTKQVGNPGASFLSQKGIYKGKSGAVVVENSAQVIILSLFGEGKNEFRKNVGKLGERIAEEFGQEVIYAELQKDGIRKKTGEITPRKGKIRKS